MRIKINSWLNIKSSMIILVFVIISGFIITTSSLSDFLKN